MPITRRTFIRLGTAALAATLLPIKWIAEKIAPRVLIAAADSSATSKKMADIALSPGQLLNEVFAQVQLEDGGVFVLSEGSFYFDDAIDSNGEKWMT